MSASVPRFPGLLEEMTVEEVRAFAAQVVLVPLGSTEPHGPHLPYGTDSYQVTHLCRLGVEQANQRGARALLYPTLPITNNVNFRAFPLALRVSVRTLTSILLDIVSQCRDDGIHKIVVVNGHGGNGGAIEAALREIAGMDDMPFVCATSGHQLAPESGRHVEHPSDHGGESETSRMLAIRPELVRTGRLADNPFGELRVQALRRTSFVRPWHLYVPVSAGGETRSSSAEKGLALQGEAAAALADLLVELATEPYGPHFPYA